VTKVAISADGEYIAVGSHDYRVYLFHKDNSTPLWSYTTGERVGSVAISANGDYIVAKSSDHNVYFFDKDSSTPLWSYTIGGWGFSVAISADGEYIVAATGNGDVYLFGRDSSTPLWKYSTEGNRALYSVAISADGEYIVAGGHDRKVYFFDKDSGTPLWNHTTDGSVESISISADGEYIAAGFALWYGSGAVYLFDKDSSTPLWSYETGGGCWISEGETECWNGVRSDVGSVSISADGKYIAAGSFDKKVYLFLNNLLPTAIIDSIDPSPAEKGASVFFNGTGSDTDGTIAAYHWESSINGELSTDKDFSTSELSLGHHTITFRVQDNNGGWSTDSETLWIYTIPVALAGDDITVNSGDDSVKFRGQGTDMDGTIVLYEWDFDGDGIFEWSSTENGRELNVYNNAGTYTATLRVTDNDGNTATDSLAVTVEEEEETLAGQCTCPDGSKGQMVGPADDDGVDDGCLCATSEDDSLPAISLIPALISIGLVAVFRRRY